MTIPRLLTPLSFTFIPILSSLTNFTHAVTCTVDAVGPATYASIQPAIDDVTCDTISIAPDTYVENLLINRALRLEGGGAYPADTIIDGGGVNHVIEIWEDPISEVVISNLTVQNGAADRGAGIYTGSSLVVDNVVVTQNIAGTKGGGIYVLKGPLIVYNSTIIDNEAGESGGGIEHRPGIVAPSYISDSQIIDNQVNPGAGVNVGGAGIHNKSNLTITNTTISGNITPLYGGGIFNNIDDDSLTLINVVVDGNEAGLSGAGIYNYGEDSTLIVEDSEIINNVATDWGGGLYNKGSVTTNNSTISNNTADWGAGVLQLGGDMTLTDTNILDNHATTSGGGIWLGDGTLELSGGSVTMNTTVLSGGGIYAGGWMVTPGTSLLLGDTTVSDNSAEKGGGISTFVATEITGSTISGNSATIFGGGVYGTDPSAIVTVTNSTISGNHADVDYGGIYFLTSDLVLNNVTVTANSMGSAYGVGGVYASGNATVRNSIIAMQTAGEDCLSLTSLGYNIESGTLCGFTAVGDQQNTDPLLLPLADNGGSTETHAIPFDSPAIDAADPLGCLADQDGDGTAETTLVTDQRGQMRVDVYGVNNDDPDEFCDVGAYEFDPFAINGSFEGTPDANGIPPQWDGLSFVAGVDGQDCADAYVDSCSLVVEGDGTLKKARQIVHQGGLAGDNYTLSLWSSADNAMNGMLRAVIRVHHVNGTNMYTFVALDKGTHGWQEYVLPFTTTDDYDYIRVLPLVSQLQSGTVHVDSVSLVKN